MGYKIVKENKARCKKCKELVISKSEQVVEQCGCGALKAGGGKSWIYRSGKSGVDYDELSILNFENVPDSIQETNNIDEQQNQ